MSAACLPLNQQPVVSLLAIGAIILVGLLPPRPAAAFSWEPTELEFYLLPNYCKARISDFHRNRVGSWPVRFPINEPEIARWKKLIGPDWGHLHHFCWGIAILQTNPPNYERAMAEITYTRSRSKPGEPMWSELSVKYARAQEGTGALPAAIKTLADLTGTDPKNGEVWLALGQTYQRAGQLDEAIAAMEEGIQRTGKPGPFLFWLARYWYDKGDIAKATELTAQAEKAGMKMDSLRAKLGRPAGATGAAATPPAAVAPPLTGSIPVPAGR